MSKNWSLVTRITNLGRINEKKFMLSRTQGQIIDLKCKNRDKSAFLIFFIAIIELVREILISNMHNKFGKDTWKTFPSYRTHKGGGPRVVVSTAAFHARVRGSVPGLGGLKETKLFLPHPRVKVSIVGSLRDREVACSASDRQGSNFESCVWRTVSSQSSHHPQEVLLAQFSLYVHKGGLKPDSFHFIYRTHKVKWLM